MIRSATVADYPAVEALWLELNAHHVAVASDLIRTVDVYMPRADYEAVLADSGQDILVYDKHGIRGAAWVIERRHEGGHAIVMPVVFIHEICVSARARRQGIGRALMAAVEDWAQTRGAERVEFNVWAGNREAVAFYQALGYGFARHEMTRVLAP